MSRSPYLIVKEFSDSDNEQHRKNAATALAVLADEESLKELLRLGLNDQDAGVRERAEREIASLPPEPLRIVLEWLKDRVQDAHPEERNAYRLLGGLRSRGIAFTLPHIPLVRRLRLAKSLWNTLHPVTNLRLRFRVLWPALLGAVVGSILFALGLIGIPSLHASAGDLYTYFLGSVFIGVVLGVSSVQLSVPISLHADKFAASALDIGMTLACSLGVSLLLTLFASLSNKQRLILMCVALMLPALAVATRAAMLLVFGARKSRAGNRWMETFCGVAAGVLAVSLVPAVFGLAGNGFVGGLWLIAVPVSVALASAFAALDVKATALPVAPRLWRTAGLLPLVALVAAAILLYIPDAGLVPRSFVNEAISDRGGPSEQHIIQLKQAPASIPLNLLSRQSVRVSLAHPGNGYVTVAIRKGSEGAVEFTKNESAFGVQQSVVLESGAHIVEISPPAQTKVEDADKTLSAILEKLSPQDIRARIARTPSPAPLQDEVCTVTLVLNSDAKPPSK